MLERPEFDALIALYDQAEDVVAEMIRQFNIGLTEDFLASAELRTLLMPAIRAEFRMGARYRFTPSRPGRPPSPASPASTTPTSPGRTRSAGASTRRLFRLHLREGAHFLVVDDRDFIVETINRELQP